MATYIQVRQRELDKREASLNRRDEAITLRESTVMSSVMATFAGQQDVAKSWKDIADERLALERQRAEARL